MESITIETVDDALDRIDGGEPRYNTSLVDMSYDIVERVCKHPECPVSSDHFIIAEKRFGRGSKQACAAPIGVEKFTPSDSAWEVSNQPRKYLIVVSSQLPSFLVETVIKHEMAHCIDWHVNLQTTEQTGEHQRWIQKLKAL